MKKPLIETRPLTADEVQEHLDDVLDILQEAVGTFDGRGKTNQAKTMAGAIRTLFHQSHTSHALIRQAGLAQRAMLSSAIATDELNLLPECGLLAMGFSPSGMRYLAQLDGTPMEFISQVDWWSGPVLDDKAGLRFSRSDLILALANKDGGSHVDPMIPVAYARFREAGLGMQPGFDGKRGVYPERHAVRQIAHEVLKSLLPDYSKPLDLPEPMGLMADARIEKGSKTTARVIEHYASTPPTVDCPCGSDRPFAKCHGMGGITPTVLIRGKPVPGRGSPSAVA